MPYERGDQPEDAGFVEGNTTPASAPGTKKGKVERAKEEQEKEEKDRVQEEDIKEDDQKEQD